MTFLLEPQRRHSIPKSKDQRRSTGREVGSTEALRLRRLLIRLMVGAVAERLEGKAMKHGYCDNIERLTLQNEDFRRVLYTGGHVQLVLMTLQPGEQIGEEVHPDRDQFFRFEQGSGAVDIDGVENRVEQDFAVIVPAGARHNVRNTGPGPLKLYTIYGPPEHIDGLSEATRAEALATREEWDGRTTE